MKTVVTGKNISITEKIQGEIDKKFDKLGKYFADDIKAHIMIQPEKAKVKVEATISTKGQTFRAEDVKQDVFDAIDVVAEKLSTQLVKYKGKMVKKHKANESLRFEMIPEVEVEEAKLVKSKKFVLSPMTVEEALMQMESLGHDFYVFVNIETDQVSVCYKRADGDYGVLNTEY